MISHSPRDPKIVVECNDDGIYNSHNGCTTWEDITNELEISQFYRISSSPTGNIIIGGLQGNGTKLMENNVWYDILSGGGAQCIVDPTDIEVAYASHTYGKVVASQIAHAICLQERAS